MKRFIKNEDILTCSSLLYDKGQDRDIDDIQRKA